MKRLIPGFVAVLANAGAFAQTVLQGDALLEAYELSGLGVIGRVISGETRCWPNEAGSTAAVLTDSIEGLEVARLEWRPEGGGCRAHLVRSGPDEPLYRGWDFVEISYESAAVVYYELRDGFARVFARRAPPGFWLRIADIPDGRPRPWAELMTETPRTYLGYEGRELHEQPTTDSRIVVRLRERRAHATLVHEIIPTGEITGDWGRFDVVEWNSDFVFMARAPNAAPTGNRWQGWLRLVNDEGSPEFWFYTRD